MKNLNKQSNYQRYNITLKPEDKTRLVIISKEIQEEVGDYTIGLSTLVGTLSKLTKKEIKEIYYKGSKKK